MEDEYKFGALNFVAHPHPEGIYSHLLLAVSNRAVRFWGDDMAAISAPVKIESGFYYGRIVIWTEIDPDSPAINIEELSETNLNEIDFSIPENIGFNGRVFSYLLHERRHVILFETENDFQKRLSPSRAEKIFNRLMNRYQFENTQYIIDITAIPEDDSLERILSIPKINRIKIRVKRPNPDEFGDEASEILEELREQGAKQQDIDTYKAPEADTINLNDRNKKIAKVASKNGYVEVKGKNDHGESVERSTREHPKVIKIMVDASTAFFEAAIRAAKENWPDAR